MGDYNMVDDILDILDSSEKQAFLDMLKIDDNTIPAIKKDLRKLLWEKFPEVLTDRQKERKILTLLTYLKKKGELRRILQISRLVTGFSKDKLVQARSRIGSRLVQAFQFVHSEEIISMLILDRANL